MIRTALASLLITLCCAHGLAQPGGVISRLFAATSDGVHLSYSWGEHWDELHGELRGFEGELFAFACLGPVVFAGGETGLYVSDDFGESYRRIESFPGEEVVTLLPARLFALEPTLLVGTTDGLYRSTNGGTRFTRLGTDLVEGEVFDLAWPGPELFAATSSGLFVTEDLGDTWTSLETGLPAAPLTSVSVSSYFVADPVVFVGSRSKGLFRSRDGGRTFEPVAERELGSASINDLFWWGELLLIGTDRGLYLTRDGGESMERVEALAEREILSISIPAPEGISQSDMLFGTDEGVYKSSDGGRSFRLLDEGLGRPRVRALATFPQPVQDRERR